MTDIIQLINAGKKLAHYVSRVLEISTPRPNWNEKQAGWRHDIEYPRISLFLLTKLAGSVSTANAMLKLTEQGFWFQSAILARSIHDANLSIAFIMPKPTMKKGDWPSTKQEDALREFFKETWSDPERPFENASQRSQILLKELSAALGHFQPKDADISQYDATQSAVQTLRFLSDYTHMAYPRLMELFEAQRGYVLCGQKKGVIGFDFRQAAGVFFGTCISADNVSLLMVNTMKGLYDLACSKNNQTAAEKYQTKLAEIQNLQKKIEELCKEIEEHFPVTTLHPERVLNKFKGK